eukprot:SAG31_NODE_1515_length_8037_cov_2.470773_2_plen_69_part_00
MQNALLVPGLLETINQGCARLAVTGLWQTADGWRCSAQQRMVMPYEVRLTLELHVLAIAQRGAESHRS